MPAERRTHFRTCNLCEAMCGLRVELEDERIVAIRGDEEDPFSHGHICPKAVALRDLQDDPDRLRRPLRRKGDGWEELSWDQALDLTAERLHAVQREHGRHAVAAYLGNPTVHNHGAMLFAPMLLRTLRTHNRFSATSVDQLPHMLAAHLMFGHQLLLPVPDLDRTRYMLMLGANPVASNGSLMTAPNVRNRLRAIGMRGGKLVVVDPRRTETAQMADEHVFIRPGTDALLLLGLLHVIFAEGLEKLGALEPFCDGLGEVRRIASGFSPERVEAGTGVPAATVRRLARELAAADGGVCYGRVGACTQPFGTLCAWAINVINVVTANLDRPGGAMFTKPAVDVVRAPRGSGAGPGSFGRWKSRVRGLPEFGGELPVATLAEEILEPGDGRIRALVTFAGNPVLSTPNGGQLDRALGSLDFMVSVDPYVNETTRHADVILPPTPPLERSHYDLAFHLLAVRNTAKYSAPLYDKPAEARHDWEILLGLQRRIEALRARGKPVARLRAAAGSRALRALGPDGLLAVALRVGPYRLPLSELKDAPHGMDLGPLAPCLPDRLPGKEKRIALAPAAIVADVERLERQFPAVGTASGDDSALLLIGRRQLRTNNSWMHNAPVLMKGRDRCTLLIHPDDAVRLGVEHGADVVVRSRVGEVRAPAEISDEMMPGVVSLPHGFGHDRPGVQLRVAGESPGASINDLTDDQLVDAVSGNAAFSGVPVQVAPG